MFMLQTTTEGKNTWSRFTVGDLILYTTVDSVNSKKKTIDIVNWFNFTLKYLITVSNNILIVVTDTYK